MATHDLADALIRIASPEVAAARLGWKLADVLARRATLGLRKLPAEKYRAAPPDPPPIPPPRVPRVAKPHPNAWSAAECELFQRFGPTEVAKQTGRTLVAAISMKNNLRLQGVKFGDLRFTGNRVAVGRSIWTPETDALLGTMTDCSLARQLGVHLQTVTRRRTKLGLPVYKRPPREKPPLKRPLPQSWTKAHDRLVATLPIDEAVAATGRTRAAVNYRRVHLRKLGNKVLSPRKSRQQ